MVPKVAVWNEVWTEVWTKLDGSVTALVPSPGKPCAGNRRDTITNTRLQDYERFFTSKNAHIAMADFELLNEAQKFKTTHNRFHFFRLKF